MTTDRGSRVKLALKLKLNFQLIMLQRFLHSLRLPSTEKTYLHSVEQWHLLLKGISFWSNPDSVLSCSVSSKDQEKESCAFFVNNDRPAFSTGCYSKLEWLLGPSEQTVREVKVFSSNGLSHFIRERPCSTCSIIIVCHAGMSEQMSKKSHFQSPLIIMARNSSITSDELHSSSTQLSLFLHSCSI